MKVLAVLFASLSTCAGTLSGLSERLVGHPVDLRCVSQSQWDSDPLVVSRNESAYVAWLEGKPAYAVFSPGVCEPLEMLLSDPNARKTRGYGYAKEEAIALLTFVHEMGHLRGSKDEGVVECDAIRSFRGVARSIGVSAKRTSKLYAHALAFHKRKPYPYQSVC